MRETAVLRMRATLRETEGESGGEVVKQRQKQRGKNNNERAAHPQGVRRLDVTNGRAKRVGEWQGDGEFTRQVLRRGGSIQYFPSDSAPAANQTQMRNTNTCIAAQKLYNGACFVILELFQAFFLLSSVASSSCTYGKACTQCPLKEWLWSGMIEEDVVVHHTKLLQNGSVRLCTGCDDGLRPTPVSAAQLVSSSCWCRTSWHAPLLSIATYGSMCIHR